MAAILADDIFKCIFLKENDRIAIQIKFVLKGLIDNNSALGQVMAWRRTGDKPLPEPRITQVTNTYICGTRGRWVNIDGYRVIYHTHSWWYVVHNLQLSKIDDARLYPFLYTKWWCLFIIFAIVAAIGEVMKLNETGCWSGGHYLDYYYDTLPSYSRLWFEDRVNELRWIEMTRSCTRLITLVLGDFTIIQRYLQRVLSFICIFLCSQQH